MTSLAELTRERDEARAALAELTEVRPRGGEGSEMSVDRDARYKQLYNELKARDFEVYREAIQHGEGFTLNHNLPMKAAVELEMSFVSFALWMLDRP